jgi:hypothetical protein
MDGFLAAALVSSGTLLAASFRGTSYGAKLAVSAGMIASRTLCVLVGAGIAMLAIGLSSGGLADIDLHTRWQWTMSYIFLAGAVFASLFGLEWIIRTDQRSSHDSRYFLFVVGMLLALHLGFCAFILCGVVNRGPRSGEGSIFVFSEELLLSMAILNLTTIALVVRCKRNA